MLSLTLASYDHRMKTAISVTLAPDNLLWLKARAQAKGSRSVSAALDEVLSEARRASGPVRSVIGTIRLPEGEAGLRRGSEEIGRLFDKALGARSVRRKRHRG
jgi:hypothetical protein